MSMPLAGTGAMETERVAQPLSPRNRTVHRLRDLSKSASARKEHGLFVAEGWKLVELAFDSPVVVTGLYFHENAVEDPSALRLAGMAAARSIPVCVLSEPAWKRVSDTMTPQPVLALVSRPEPSMAALDGVTFSIVCVDVRDPGNMGSVIRVAMAAGAGAVVVAPGCADPYSTKAVRSSAGSVFGMPVVEADAMEVMERFRRDGTVVVGTIATGGVPHTEYSFEGPFALVLGNEGSGLPGNIARHMDAMVTVPLANEVESLNVATACAVLCFEAVRQRGACSSGAPSSGN
ncbi:MAG: RNA methyltransferase [Actinobacteria bacterium]|nr:RNA methyltransferase [Actinomycetota bacterium]MCL5446146.1 RNA methyltransferase [Actinomycetota bacterium]